MTLLDSSILIAAERGQFDLRKLASGGEGVALAAVTASELLHGVYRARNAEQRTRREAFVERLLAVLPVIPFDLTAARIHARVWAELAAHGITLGAHDLLIASTAMAAGAAVATRDQRSFPRIPGLAVRDW